MRTTKERILSAAGELFAEKGYAATSVQEIVKQSQISKGSFYNYFKSKEDLALSLYQQKHQELWEEIQALEEEESDSRRSFAAQLTAQLKHVDANRELIQMVFQYASNDQEFHRRISRDHLRLLQWVSRRLMQIYGERVAPYTIDCAAILIGMIFTHFLRLFVHPSAIDFDAFAPYLLRRLDGVVSSFGKDEEPLLTQEMIDSFLQQEEQERKHRIVEAQQRIDALRSKLEETKLEKKRFEQIVSCLDTLEREIASEEEPREYIIEGLLLYLRKQKLSEWDEELAQLTRLIWPNENR